MWLLTKGNPDNETPIWLPNPENTLVIWYYELPKWSIWLGKGNPDGVTRKTNIRGSQVLNLFGTRKATQMAEHTKHTS